MIERCMWLNIFIFKTKPPFIPGFVAYLIEDNALDDLCGKTLGIRSFKSVTKKRYYPIGKCVSRDIFTAMIKIMQF